MAVEEGDSFHSRDSGTRPSASCPSSLLHLQPFSSVDPARALQPLACGRGHHSYSAEGTGELRCLEPEPSPPAQPRLGNGRSQPVSPGGLGPGPSAGQLASGTLKHSSLYVGTCPRCSVNKPGLGPAPRGALLSSSSNSPVKRRDSYSCMLLDEVISFWASAGSWHGAHPLLSVMGGGGG